MMALSQVDLAIAQVHRANNQPIQAMVGEAWHAELMGGGGRNTVSTKNSKTDLGEARNTDKASESTTAKATCTTGISCFTAGTLIETKDGLKAVETFTGGELIWTRNDITLEYGYRPVIATKATPDQPIFQVTVKNHQGDIETLQTTAEHPFWIKDSGWLKASLLEQGMILLDRNNQEVEVLSQYLLPNHTDTVYNIEVDDFHTYHVGRLGVWVHNADCCGRGLTGNNWTFNPNKDVDLRGTGKSYRDALDEAFKRTGVPKEQFVITKWAKDKYGKSIPVEYSAPNGANVNIDIPKFNNVTNGVLGNGPHQPHIGYQNTGKGSNRIRGHIFVDEIPATRR